MERKALYLLGFCCVGILLVIVYFSSLPQMQGFFYGREKEVASKEVAPTVPNGNPITVKGKFVSFDSVWVVTRAPRPGEQPETFTATKVWGCLGPSPCWTATIQEVFEPIKVEKE
jgi:hypothetical protein